MIIFSWPTIEKSFVKIFQGLREYHIGQKLVQDDQVYQSHQISTDLDAYSWKTTPLKKVEDDVTETPPKKKRTYAD